jgi:hypothetical protein
MVFKTKIVSWVAFELSLLFLSSYGFAQSDPLYVPLPNGVKAVLYRPDSNPNSKVSVIVIHRTSNYLNHPACTQLSSRGLLARSFRQEGLRSSA